ncbi:M56 family metallopeptidase [Nocardioides sp.]|uniref:M56 family metallopeptidase n=1 Tax=Nocardioides sp. TaxID=35761 RepID=UPI002735F744|nr:M56 family metallopeptidase [Nocardioides sp.]MDP3892087.1 M56 family metallopeptidase [Nocardioides sp.]
MTTVMLGALAVLLAGPVPAGMARWPRLRRTPRAAMVLWQSVALAAVLAALGAGLSLVTDQAWRAEVGPARAVVAGAALALTLFVAGRLLLSAHRVGTSLRRLRRRHRAQLDLLARHDAAVEVLEHDVPVAYCVPGLRDSRVVVSAGMLGTLSEPEIEAVLAHERAHLRARHDLVLEAFSALHRAFPRWVSSEAALSEVRLLIEVLADRAAMAACDPGPLARALVALAAGRAPEAALAVGACGLVERVDLLADRQRHRVQAAVLLALSGAVLVLPTAFVVLPWLDSLA